MFMRWGLMGRVPDWIVQLGLSPRESLARLYKSAGICCFPSLFEPLPYTCLEAMASGGLVVGTSRTGMAEILTETSGFLVLPGDVSGLVEALSSALSMSDVARRRMREAAQQRIRDRFDNRVIIPELLSVYNETITSYRN
jgi:glycosyltransferase involved in cell wall biosynthesis